MLPLITSVLLLTVALCAGLQYEQISQEIEQIEGVITHGLLLGVADAVVVADPKQGVRLLEPKAAAAAAAAASSS
jgi:ribose 5-phosphate isomerase